MNKKILIIIITVVFMLIFTAIALFINKDKEKHIILLLDMFQMILR